MKDEWLRRTLSVLMGGAFALLLPVTVRPWVWAALVLIGVRLWVWRPSDFFGQLAWPGLVLLAALFIAGYLYAVAGEQALPEPLTLETVEVTGVVKDWSRLPDQGSGSLLLEAVRGQDESEKITLGRKYRLVVYPDGKRNLPGLWEKVQPGDALTFKARLERPKPRGTPGGFDPQAYAAARGFEGTLIARGEPVSLYPGNPPPAWRVRQQVNEALKPFTQETGETRGVGTRVAGGANGAMGEIGVLQGILFGDTSGISAEVLERYRVTGVLHVFAASGSNVAFVIAFSWGLLRFFPQGVRVAGSSLAVLFYALLCGGSLPIVRASIMGIAVLWGRLSRGKVANLRWLALAALGMFLANPMVLKDVGFQLSVAAAWGIVSVAPRLKALSGLAKLPRSLRGLLAATLAAQITMLPLLISAFHRISIIGFVANLFVLFLLGSVLEVGLVGVLFSFVPALAAPFFQVSLWLLQGANKILGWLAQLSWADFWVLQPGFLFWLMWYGAILVWLFGYQKAVFILRTFLRQGIWKLRACAQTLGFPEKKTTAWRILKSAAATRGGLHDSERMLPWEIFIRQVPWGRLLLGLVLVFLLWSPWSGRELSLSFLDVGQGDSLLIQTPGGRAILIDAGPKTERFDAGERIILPYLLQNRIRHLDAFILTHEHADHLGGARAILNNVPVDWVGIPDVGDRLSNPEWREGLPERVWLDAEKLRTLRAGDRIELDGGAWLEVLGPVEILKGSHSDPNNNSLVLMLHYLNQNVFLTADMEAEEMRTLWGVQEETVDFYKEPHHGSRFSLDKDLLDTIKPEAVLISVGRNTFGHPAPEVLRYWQERGIPVYRTDEGGTLTLRLGKAGTAIETGRRPD